MNYLERRTSSLATACCLALGAGLAMACDKPAKLVAGVDDPLQLCLLDGKKNSIGSMVKISEKSYRCTQVLTERGEPGTAWVEVRMTAAIAGY